MLSGFFESSGKLEIALIDLSTSIKAFCISAPLLNSKRISAIPSFAVDFVFFTLSIYLTFSSIGFIIEDSISFGLAPGHSTFTVI